MEDNLIRCRQRFSNYEKSLNYLKTTVDSAFKMVYLATQEVQEKWSRNGLRNWSEIYPQLCIFFSEIMEKYTK